MPWPPPAPSRPRRWASVSAGPPAYRRSRRPRRSSSCSSSGLGLAFGALLRRSAGSKEVEAPTWLCGYQDLNDANRYADRGMFAGLRGLFKFAGGKSGK